MIKQVLRPLHTTDNSANAFRVRPVNSVIAVTMVISRIADYYHWTDLGLFSERIKWVFDLLALFI